jgi:basic amino acid/polyamine antiporter, APA family
MSLKQQLFATKSLKGLLDEMAGDHRLKRVLGPVTLTALGVGAVIGAGIFVSTGAAARVNGPVLMLSYVIAGITCIFAALCYAEFASMAPVAGSAYTYAYTTLGELFAWIIGWDLVLEYAVGAATVANGWSSYFQKILHKFHMDLPPFLSGPPYTYNEEHGTIVENIIQRTNESGEVISSGHGFINLPAILIVIIITAVLVKGISESAGFNAFMVILKVAAVVFVILVGAFYVSPSNWTDNFAPKGYGGFSVFGIKELSIGWDDQSGKALGMLAGSAIIFFAYIGFDSVSTHAEEARNPRKDVPIGIIASLVICTILYVAVVAVLTGMVPFRDIDEGAGVSSAFKTHLPWAEFIINAAGVAGITSVLLVMMLSGPRVFLAMARDGLVPKAFFADVHPKFRTPWKSTIAIGLFVSVLAGLLPITALLELTNIGTLFAFIIVCGAVLIMRRTNPNANRPFRCPLVPVVPILGIVFCLVLMLSLPVGNWIRLIVWLVLGLAIYFFYGRHHSVLGKELRGEISKHGVSPGGQIDNGIKVIDTGIKP